MTTGSGLQRGKAGQKTGKYVPGALTRSKRKNQSLRRTRRKNQRPTRGQPVRTQFPPDPIQEQRDLRSDSAYFKQQEADFDKSRELHEGPL